MKRHADGTLEAETPEEEAQLDALYPRVAPGRWKIARKGDVAPAKPPGILRRVASFGKAVVSGTATPEVVERRRRSCFGGEGAAPCPDLDRRADGKSYCGSCGCGRWWWSELDTKITFGKVVCPRGRDGFDPPPPKP